jgi:hypothetical protein
MKQLFIIIHFITSKLIVFLRALWNTVVKALMALNKSRPPVFRKEKVKFYGIYMIPAVESAYGKRTDQHDYG